MSEIQAKPVVEELPAAPVEATPAVVEPVAETKVEETSPVVAAVESAPAAEEPTAAVVEETTAPEVKADVKKEFAGEGILGYKAPGGFIKKLAGFQKKHFWFGSDAVEVKHLSSYLRGEKPEIGNHNAAWATQTGKGLLFFSKHASEKSAPAGVINLAEISDITEEGTVEFLFHTHGQKHVFQAANASERDSWVAALKIAAADAKASAETITGSTGYQESHSALSKPATSVTPAAAVAKKEEKTELKEEKKEEKAVAKEDKIEAKEDKKTRKSRSASRKRNSIFGGFGLGGKKDEQEEKKPVESVPATAAATTEESAVVAVEAPVVAAPVVEEPVAVADAAPIAPVEARPAVNKRNSVFGRFSSFGAKKPAAEAAVVDTATKDESTSAEPAVSNEAPVIPAVEASEPLAADIAAPTTAPAETVAPVATEEVAAEVKPEAKPEIKSEKRKSSLPFSFSKLRQTVKSKTSSPKAEKITSEKTPEVKADDITTEEAPVAEIVPAKTTEDAIVPAPVQASVPVVSATA